MKVAPKIRGFICTTAHPAGCKQHVQSQIEYVKGKGKIDGPRRALIVGASTGYGLATRIALAYGTGASTVGVSFEKPAGSRTASAGWYNTAAFEEQAAKDGIYARDIIGDAYSGETKRKTIELIKKELGKIDLFVYSLAAPRRKTDSGETYNSVIKPVGADFSNKTIDMNTRTVTSTTVKAATAAEVADTIKVMGGEDWLDWVQALKSAGVLDDGVKVLAYSYIGPEVTHAIYRDGTIGEAKKDLENAAGKINELLTSVDGQAFVSVNKAVVTQASSAIPVVPLYITVLFKIMKAKGIHENCIEQMYRLLAEKLYGGSPVTDQSGRLRLDDWEMRDDVQQEVHKVWSSINSENADQLADIDGYWDDFYHLFGFGIPGVDYDADVDIDVAIPDIV